MSLRNELRVRETYVARVAAASAEVTASTTVDGVDMLRRVGMGNA